MGHWDVKNPNQLGIYKIALVLNYFGQAAYLCNTKEKRCRNWWKNGNPFYLIMPDWFQPIGIVIALLLLIVFTSISGSLH
jgi:KUP system potassium uptake protein